jgi:hypothetical protein
MMWALHQQQATLIVGAFLVAGCFLLKSRWDASAGIFLALTTIKPQLVGPLLLWLLLWTVLQRRWRFFASFLTSAAMLLICSLWMVPGWLPDWQRSMADYLSYTDAHPALQMMFGKWIGTLLMIAVAAATSLILWRLRRCDMESPAFGIAISLALAASVSLNPTYPAMIYNQVLLLPAFLVLIYNRPADYYPVLTRRISLVLLGCAFAVVPLAIVGETIWHPSFFWDSFPFNVALLPLSVVVALVLTPSIQPASSRDPAPSPLENSPAHSG